MKILCVIQRYYPVIGGAEYHVKQFMDYLSKKHSITVYTTNIDNLAGLWNKDSPKVRKNNSLNYFVKRYDVLTPSEIQLDQNLENFPLALNHPGPFIPKFWEELVINKIDYDMIFASSFPYDHILPAYVASKKWKIPIIIMPLTHSEHPDAFFTATKLSMLYNADGIVVSTNYEKKILETKGIDGNKISVILPPLSIKSNVELNPEKFRKKIGLLPDEKVVLYLGTKGKSKGIFSLIDAMNIVWKSNLQVRLIVAGSASNEFNKYCAKLSRKDKAKILDLGLVSEDDKQNAFCSCDVLVLPSKSESFGLVYLEAWYHQKPVIGCRIGAVSDVIDDGKNGLLVEFGNAKELAEKILYLIQNPSIAKKFGEHGKKKLENYAPEKSLKVFEEKCEKVIRDFGKIP